MSGHKRSIVQLGRQDLHRIEAINGKLRQVEKDYQEVRQSINQNRVQQLKIFTQELENRQQDFQNVLGTYDQEINSLERRSGEALLAQADHFSRLLLDQEQRLDRNSETLINQHFSELNRLMQENQQSVWDHFNDLSGGLNEFYNQQETRQVIAEKALQAAEGYLHSVDEVYDHERFFPGALERINKELEISIRNFEQGLFEASLVLAQQSSLQLSILRMDIEEIIQRNTLERSFTIEKSKSVHKLIQKNAFVPAVDLGGNLLDYIIDVDFWTSGAYTRLLKRSEGLLKQLEENSNGLSGDEYQSMQTFILPQMENSLSDLVADARTKVILSQIRFNIAETVVENLAEQGFALQDADYSETDERKPYSVIVQNLEGSQVKVFIESGDHPGQYCLQIDSENSELYPPAELKKRSFTLLHSLQKAGLRVGVPIEVQSTESKKKYFPTRLDHRNPQQLMNAYGD